jgi:hemolysin type calcium-binding protein
MEGDSASLESLACSTGRMALARIGLVGALVAVALPVSLVSVAEAAEVRLERFYFDCTRKQCPPNYGERLVVRAGRGEANRLSVGFGAAGEFQVRDAGPALHAGPGCVLSAGQLVACPTSTPLLAAYVLAGDRGDRVTSSVAVNVDGGGGDDRLAGSPLADALYGGKGRDVVRGNGGDDTLRDGRLPRLVTPEEDMGRSFPPPQLEPAIAVPAESDVFDGGLGTDTLGYEGRRRGVIADLARTDRHAGAPGEGDSLRGLEAVVGSGGDDRIFGNDLSNSLAGAGGDDLLVGRDGDDQLVGGSGSNQARGGAGDDDISPGLNADVLENVQRVRCGPGQDEVGSMFSKDFAEDDCESVVVSESFPIRPHLPLTSLARPPLATMDSPLVCGTAECSARLYVRLARSPDPRRPGLKGLVLGSASGSATLNNRITLTANLSERGSVLLRRYRSLLVRIGLSTTGALSATGGSGWYLTRLRAPAP